MSIYRCLSCKWEWEDSSFAAGVRANGCPRCNRNILRRINENEVTDLQLKDSDDS